jgi:hypothetical protein
VIEGENVDMIFTDHIEGRVGKTMKLRSSHPIVLDGVDLDS